MQGHIEKLKNEFCRNEELRKYGPMPKATVEFIKYNNVFLTASAVSQPDQHIVLHTWTLTLLQLMTSTMPTTSSNTMFIFLQASDRTK